MESSRAIKSPRGDEPFAGYDGLEHFDTVTMDIARRLISRVGSFGDRFGFLAVFFLPLGFIVFITLYFDFPPWHSYIYLIPFLVVIAAIESNSWRVRRFRNDMLRRRLCFGCGTSLLDEIQQAESGRCPNCRRLYHLAEYSPTLRRTMREVVGAGDETQRRSDERDRRRRLPPSRDHAP